MNARNRGVLIGLGGFFAGFFGAQIVGERLDWSSWTQAGAAVAIGVGVSLLLLFLLPGPNASTHEHH